MKKLHIILQGKGGVGKSLVASLLAQYMNDKGKSPLCIDTDPVNKTLAGYEGLNVLDLDIIDPETEEIDPRSFDELIEIITSSENENIIVDNGASSFLSFASFLVTNEIIELLKTFNIETYIHSVITGGQATPDTLNGLNYLFETFNQQSMFVVWINPFWGDVIVDGKGFEEFGVYKKNKDKIHTIIKIPNFKKALFSEDFSDVLSKKMTLAEAIENPNTKILPKQRLILIKREIFGLLDSALLI